MITLNERRLTPEEPDPCVLQKVQRYVAAILPDHKATHVAATLATCLADLSLEIDPTGRMTRVISRGMRARVETVVAPTGKVLTDVIEPEAIRMFACTYLQHFVSGASGFLWSGIKLLNEVEGIAPADEPEFVASLHESFDRYQIGASTFDEVTGEDAKIFFETEFEAAKSEAGE
ncbi:MAG: hypothetical protein AAGG44_19590 [Planctomycetota bacterium]